MNELPIIGYLCLCKDFWDCHGQRLQVARRKYMVKRWLLKKKTILETDQHFLAAVLSEMD